MTIISAGERRLYLFKKIGDRIQLATKNHFEPRRYHFLIMWWFKTNPGLSKTSSNGHPCHPGRSEGSLFTSTTSLHIDIDFNRDWVIGFVFEIQKPNKSERSPYCTGHARKFRARRRNHPNGMHPKRASMSRRRRYVWICKDFGSE